MKIDAFGMGIELRRAGERARDCARAGFDGLWIAETGRTAYLTCAATTLAAPELDIGTAVAIAFPRSPMVTAQIAWELAEASQGRFILGLGTQIKAHIERRFSTVYDHPGSRLREYVLALRAIFRSFSGGERLNFKGDFYAFNLLGMWSPGRLDTRTFRSTSPPYAPGCCGPRERSPTAFTCIRSIRAATSTK